MFIFLPYTFVCFSLVDIAHFSYSLMKSEHLKSNLMVVSSKLLMHSLNVLFVWLKWRPNSECVTNLSLVFGMAPRNIVRLPIVLAVLTTPNRIYLKTIKYRIE